MLVIESMEIILTIENNEDIKLINSKGKLIDKNDLVSLKYIENNPKSI